MHTFYRNKLCTESENGMKIMSLNHTLEAVTQKWMRNRVDTAGLRNFQNADFISLLLVYFMLFALQSLLC